jgi:hypothetical protein
MGILKEFCCKAHGPFEAIVAQDETPDCPVGCSKSRVKREIRTAPAARSAVMGTLDTQMRGLAHDFGLSDLKVGRDDGKSVMDNLRKGETFAPHWVGVPGHLAPGWIGRGEKPAAINPSALYGTKDANLLSELTVPTSLPTKVVGRDTTDINTVSAP